MAREYTYPRATSGVLYTLSLLTKFLGKGQRHRGWLFLLQPHQEARETAAGKTAALTVTWLRRRYGCGWVELL